MRFVEEIASEPVKEIFFRFLTVNGKEILASDMKYWGNSKIPEYILKNLRSIDYIIDIIDISGQ